MTPDSILLWMSASKPVAAVAIARLWEQGLLELDDPVADHIPEFAQHGKDTVTIRHLLTHTGGFPRAAELTTEQAWEEIIEQVSAAPLVPGWVPGKKAGYHLASSWYILAEIIARRSGEPFDEYVRTQIFEPLGMTDCWIGMPPERYAERADRMAGTRPTRAGQPLDLTPAGWPPDSAEKAAPVRPGSNGRGPARQLARLYEMLRGRGQWMPEGQPAVQILTPHSVEALTARHRVGMRDATFQAHVDFGLGFVLDSKHYGEKLPPYGYGAHASPRTFGHGGSQSSAAFCDPEHGLVVAVIFNGMPGEPAHQRRMHWVLSALYEDLGLA